MRSTRPRPGSEARPRPRAGSPSHCSGTNVSTDQRPPNQLESGYQLARVTTILWRNRVPPGIGQLEALSEHQARSSIFLIPSRPWVSVPQRKGRIHDCKLYGRFKSVFPLQHRKRPYMTMHVLGLDGEWAGRSKELSYVKAPGRDLE